MSFSQLLNRIMAKIVLNLIVHPQVPIQVADSVVVVLPVVVHLVVQDNPI
jgi:hypothetical protein